MTMSSREFVAGIRKEILDANLKIYKQMFVNSDANKATDSYGREALRFYASLDDASRETLFKIMRQAMVDTISNVFAVLDGTAKLTQESGEFLVESAGQKLNGCLQDLFLELEEQTGAE